jgi:hypothetical protein
MRVGPSMWDPPSCEGLLYSCCIGVVNLTFSYIHHAYIFINNPSLNREAILIDYEDNLQSKYDA